MMRRVLNLLSLCFLLLCGGCTTAEMGGCKNAIVNFEYRGDGTSDLFRDHIANVSYYVYNAAGSQVASGRLESADLSFFRGFRLRLEAGTYDVVCWGNLEHYCQVAGGNRKEEAHIINIAHTTGGTPRSYDPLYYGKASLNISDIEGQETAIVTFRSAHITLWAYTKGVTDYDEKGENRPPVFHVGGFNSEYNFECVGSGIPLSFSPEAVYKQEYQVSMARCEVPRFMENTSSQLKVYRQSDYKLLEVVELEQFIADNNIEITGREEVTIPILFDFQGIGVEVRMPSWDEVGITPEW